MLLCGFVQNSTELNLQNQEDSTGFLFLISNHQTNGIQKGYPKKEK